MKVLALLLVVAGLVIAIMPQSTNCEARGGTMPGDDSAEAGAQLSPATTMVSMTVPVAAGVAPKMKCLWSARGALAVGASLAVAGGLLYFARRKETRRALGIVCALLATSTLLLPTSLIGTCGPDAAVCNTTMKPIMLAAGGVALAASLVILVMNELKREAAARADAEA